MRRLIVNQKLLSIRERFTIDDEQGRPVYQAEGSLLKIPKRFSVRDLAGNELATVRRQPIALFPRFNLTIGGQPAAVIQKEFSVLRPRYRIDGPGLRVSGDIWNMSFDIHRDGHLIGRVDKRWITIRDTYAIEVIDERYELLVIGLVLAIDYVKRLDDAARTSSDSTT